ncbi:MAG: hypothetical protein ACOC3T_02790 [Bacteroidota bacterium]
MSGFQSTACQKSPFTQGWFLAGLFLLRLIFLITFSLSNSSRAFFKKLKKHPSSGLPPPLKLRRICVLCILYTPAPDTISCSAVTINFRLEETGKRTDKNKEKISVANREF